MYHIHRTHQFPIATFATKTKINQNIRALFYLLCFHRVSWLNLPSLKAFGQPSFSLVMISKFSHFLKSIFLISRNAFKTLWTCQSDVWHKTNRKSNNSRFSVIPNTANPSVLFRLDQLNSWIESLGLFGKTSYKYAYGLLFILL